MTHSTLKSEETRSIDGTDHYIINVEISSASHPFYTGKQILVDTARRVEKFAEKMKMQEKKAAVRKGKKVKRATRAKAKNSEANSEESKDSK